MNEENKLFFENELFFFDDNFIDQKLNEINNGLFENPKTNDFNHKPTKKEENEIDSKNIVPEMFPKTSSKSINDKPWKSSMYNYKILTAAQRQSLNEFFTNNRIKLTKKNCKMISQRLKVPYKKVLNYIFDNSGELESLIENEKMSFEIELDQINRTIDMIWQSYCEVQDIFASTIHKNLNKPANENENNESK